jgi:hypothetical protein
MTRPASMERAVRKCALPHARRPDARIITPTEVQKWFMKIKPNNAQYEEIATRLTAMRWPSDQPQVPLPDDAKEWYWRARMSLPNYPPFWKPDSVGTKEWWDFEQPRGPGGIVGAKYVLQADDSGLGQESWVSQDIIWDPSRDVKWWDIQGTADAANKLRDAIPLMLSYWDGVRHKREKCEGAATMGERYDAMKALDDALTAAMPCFYPFGEIGKPSPRKRRKAWHMPAVLIAHFIGKALVASGYDTPNLDRKSAVVRIVRTALTRMDHDTVTFTAVSKHLKSWTAKYGWIEAPSNGKTKS